MNRDRAAMGVLVPLVFYKWLMVAAHAYLNDMHTQMTKDIYVSTGYPVSYVLVGENTAGADSEFLSAL